ncbi:MULTISPECIES: hypothetical protein [Paraburkholderia]|jgi:hypothetical protein|uniref:hypothetical protein n=1 Tax=Paraburkholderia TaxID=1822464 RepID=UPI0038BA22DB
MSDSGWDIAMRRIDAEFDVPQFVASSLVRKIAANNFQLPVADRATFAQLPDGVIARIVQIVREAYLEAGEDVGGEVLRAHLWQQALAARREMIASGELVTPTEFRMRIGVSEKRLAKWVAEGSVFAVDVEEGEYFPALLADPKLDRVRLQVICRIVAPAPPNLRLGFLTSRRGSLGDRSPVDMLDGDDDFKRLQHAAEAWAAEWSRTAVKVFDGLHETEPRDAEPLYIAIAEIDPRRPLWERASEALHASGYEWPLGPYPSPRTFTVFVERHTTGSPERTPEACIQVSVMDDFFQVRIWHCVETVHKSQATLAARSRTVVDAVKTVIAHFCKR